MIRENQKLLNTLHVLSDGAILFLSFPAAFWIRFSVFHGIVTVPLSAYVTLAAVYTGAQLFTYAAFGLYQSFRRKRLRYELLRLWGANTLDMSVLLGLLFLSHEVHYSRWVLAIMFLLSNGGLSAKRYFLRKVLRRYRQAGYNQKHVLLLGSGRAAARYLREIREHRELGYVPAGFMDDGWRSELDGLTRLGGYGELAQVLEALRPDEVVAAMEPQDFPQTPEIIEACEEAGVRLSIIPFYANYMPSNPQFDDLNGIPMLNIRHIPLDNWANAFCKRAMDLAGSGFLLVLAAPVMLACAVGVKLSSPGPVLFRQERIGKEKRPFYMYKFRSMRVNDRQDTAWSRDRDERKTAFGAFMRKCSLDELPQLWNVFKGDMSLVGPRPEIPHYVEQFRKEVPLYMVKHQVRPGITGWAQVNGLRGDTSIRERVELDVYYIEHWSLWFDIHILLTTVFGGKFINSEDLGREKAGRGV